MFEISCVFMFAFCNEQVIVFLRFEMHHICANLKKKTPLLILA